LAGHGARDDLASAVRQARLEGLRSDLALILLRTSELLGPSTAEGQDVLKDACEIAELRVVSEHTVINHLSHIFASPAGAGRRV
jgi:hypothetical protein